MKGISKGEARIILLTSILVALTLILLVIVVFGYLEISPPSPPPQPSKIVLLIDNRTGYGFVDVNVFNWGDYIDNATVKVTLLRGGILKETEKMKYTGSIPSDTGTELTFDFRFLPYAEYRVDVKFDEIDGDRSEHLNEKINW